MLFKKRETLEQAIEETRVIKMKLPRAKWCRTEAHPGHDRYVHHYRETYPDYPGMIDEAYIYNIKCNEPEEVVVLIPLPYSDWCELQKTPMWIELAGEIAKRQTEREDQLRPMGLLLPEDVRSQDAFYVEHT